MKQTQTKSGQQWIQKIRYIPKVLYRMYDSLQDKLADKTLHALYHLK